MRPIWKGHLTFGLVMMPVTLYSAESVKGEFSFTMLDQRDHSRIRYKRINESTGKEVPWKSIVKGYEVSDGEFVTLTEADFKKASTRATKLVELSDFVPRAQIAPQYFETPYFLEPAAGGEKVYTLLRDTLERTGQAGVGSVVIHTRQYMAAVLPHGPALVLNTMRYADELRGTADLRLPARSPKSRPSGRELAMAEKLIEQMTSRWSPLRYHDEYRDELRRWVAQKARTGRIAPAPRRQEAEERSYNIMDLLKKSVEESRRAEPRPAPRRARHRKAG